MKTLGLATWKKKNSYRKFRKTYTTRISKEYVEAFTPCFTGFINGMLETLKMNHHEALQKQKIAHTHPMSEYNDKHIIKTTAFISSAIITSIFKKGGMAYTNFVNLTLKAKIIRYQVFSYHWCSWERA
nr:16076_t:CDS:1 [Entrophospora candida]